MTVRRPGQRGIIPLRRVGRPAVNREELLERITKLRRIGRDRVRLPTSQLAKQLECHRSTIWRGVADLERAGKLRRVRLRGCRPTRVEIFPDRASGVQPTVLVRVVAHQGSERP